jgi:hypothetical protein
MEMMRTVNPDMVMYTIVEEQDMLFFFFDVPLTWNHSNREATKPR